MTETNTPDVWSNNDYLNLAAHELRSPLGTLKAIADNLLLELYGPLNPKQHSVLERFQQRVDKLGLLLERFLELALYENARIGLQYEAIELGTFLRACAENYREQLEARHVQVELLLPKQDCIIKADSALLDRVVSNLFDNALRFTQDRITLELKHNGTTACVAISDNGPGIPSAELNKIFEKFYQVRNAHNPSGFGLGLTFCRHVIQLHDGKLWAENLTPQGAIFRCELPLANAPEP